MRVTLIGVDPGIVDTAAVALELDTEAKSLRVQQRVWRGVTQRIRKSIIVEETFLAALTEFAETVTDSVKFAAVEGFRPRGKNIAQDQNMTVLVQACHKALPTSRIVDNTGLKKVVLPETLKLFGCWEWDVKTHHSDLTSAARVALKNAYDTPGLTELIADYIIDHKNGESWVSL